MLTNKNRARKAFLSFSTIRRGKIAAVGVCTAFLLVGCQPPGPKSLLLGEKYLEQGDYQKALKHLTRASELMDEHPQVWNHLGLAYHGVNQPTKAVEAYQRAIRIDRNLPAPHYNLGVLLLEQNHLPQAVAELNSFVNLQTNSSLGWTKLGTALVRLKRADDAERALQIALRIDPKNAEAHNSLGLAHLQRKRPRDAMISFNNALQQQVNYSPALLNQAVVAHQHFGNKELALERYRAYLTTKPDPKSTAQVQQAIALLEKEIAGVEVAEADPPRTETNAFTAFLRSNAAPARGTGSTSQVAVAKSTGASTNTATNLAVRVGGAKTNAVPATNAVVANIASTNSAPVRAATNAVAQLATNSPVTTQTNVAVALDTTKPETKPEAETKPESQPEPVPEPEPVEVVSIEDEPELKPVADFTEVKPVLSEAPKVVAAAVPEEKPLIIPRRERKEEEKPGFFSRANPIRWFKDNNKAVEQVHAKAAPREEDVPAPVRQTYRPPIKSVPDPQPEPPRVIARYQYRKNIPLKEGNRMVAQKVFQQGTSAHQQRRLADAMEAYQHASTLDPSFYDAHYNLGVAAYQVKNLPLALAANELAIAAKPSSVDARYNFALTLRDANYPLDAANELKKLLESHPEEVRAHFALANLYAQQLDQPILARQHYVAVLELRPSHAEAPLIRQWLAARQ